MFPRIPPAQPSPAYTRTPAAATLTHIPPVVGWFLTPWFEGDPGNYSGFEGEIANEIGERMDVPVEWVVEPFNRCYAPGSKNYDFDINQITRVCFLDEGRIVEQGPPERIFTSPRQFLGRIIAAGRL